MCAYYSTLKNLPDGPMLAMEMRPLEMRPWEMRPWEMSPWEMSPWDRTFWMVPLSVQGVPEPYKFVFTRASVLDQRIDG